MKDYLQVSRCEKLQHGLTSPHGPDGSPSSLVCSEFVEFVEFCKNMRSD